MATGSVTQGGDWRIAETGKRCVGCGSPFLARQEFYSQLEITAGDDVIGLVRRDWCPPCWTQASRQIVDPVYWKTRRRGNERERNLVDLTSLHALFLSLLEDKRPEVEALRYVVALLLLRKKILKVVRVAGGARGDLVFKDPRRMDQRLRLPSPDLSEESLAHLKEQLGQIVQG